MQRDARLSALEALFVDVARAHQEARADDDGVDPEWALWFAEWLAPRLAPLLDRALGKSELVYSLITADREQQVQDEELWPAFYARFFAERFVAGEGEQVALYCADGDPYSAVVCQVLAEIGGEEVELRDVWQDAAHRQALIAARGRATVPVLRAEGRDGVRWMPESAEIIRYLRARFAKPSTSDMS